MRGNPWKKKYAFIYCEICQEINNDEASLGSGFQLRFFPSKDENRTF